MTNDEDVDSMGINLAIWLYIAIFIGFFGKLVFGSDVWAEFQLISNYEIDL